MGFERFNRQVIGARWDSRYVSQILTSAQVLTLNSAPVEVIPAPKADEVNVVERLVASLDFNSAAYTSVNPLQLHWSGDLAVDLLETDIAAALIGSGADRSDFSVGASNVPSMRAGESVVAQVATGNPATGDSPLVLQVFYRIIQTRL